MESITSGHALILDMDAERSGSIAQILKEQGFAITQMQGVGAALAVCARVPFAIILLGEVPEGHDRPAVCRALRQMSNSALLALASDISPDAVMPLLDAGASDIVPSYPLDPDRLRLRVVVAKRRAAAQSHAEAMLRAMPDLVFRFSGSAEFLAFHSTNTTELFAPADRIVGRKIEEVLPVEVARLTRAALKRAFDTGELQVITYRLDVPRGAQDYEARIVPSGPDEALAIVRNITARTQADTLGRANVSLAAEVVERRRAEEALRASEAQWRSLVQSSPDYVVTIDGEGRITFVNRPDPKMGLVSGRRIFEIAPPTSHPALREQLARVFAKGEAGALEIVVDAERHLAFDVRIAPITSEGPVKSAVILARDIAERRAAEAERARMQERLLTAQKLDSLGLLAGGVAHDFNNLLTAILGSASVALLKLPAEGPARRAIETLVAAARRASELTQQLLAYSGRGKFEVKPVDLSEQIRELTIVLEAAVPKRISLKTELDPKLPTVLGDVGQMQQVVMNLVINASEAIGDRAGSIQVRTGRATVGPEERDEPFFGEPPAPGEYVCLEVKDDGCGMDAETIAKVFDPFFTTKATGRGLGLAAVHGIVRSHHGALRIKSSPGGGSTFRVLLPASASPAEARGSEPSPTSDGGGLILVVDDENLLRRAACQIIEHFGYGALEAEDGFSAIEIYRERSREIAIVLLDMTMPGMSGEETFHELRRIRPDACVILSSGFNELEATRRFSGTEFAAFLQKPYTAEQLAECLSRVRSSPNGRS
ncbi:MAG: response regulator [Polyangiaceae bacterium]